MWNGLCCIIWNIPTHTSFKPPAWTTEAPSGPFDDQVRRRTAGPPDRGPQAVARQGRYTDDIGIAGQAYAVMVRSNVAHGIINGIDTEAAKAMPGVLAVLTAEDLKAYGG
ncbi:MAG: hypothetical protein WDN48_17265 [Pseudolabrys sp.]